MLCQYMVYLCYLHPHFIKRLREWQRLAAHFHTIQLAHGIICQYNFWPIFWGNVLANFK